MYRYIIIVFVFLSNIALSQDTPVPPNTPDSTKIYENLHRFAKRNRLTYWMYKNLFVVPQSSLPVLPKPMPPNSAQIKNARKKGDEMEQYKNIAIRYIEIVSLDPFGTSLSSYDVRADNIIKKAGNRMHIKTKRSAVRRQLLFKTGDLLDPLKLKETERLLRASGNIRDALITVVPSSEVCDSVDVRIVVQDQWSMTPYASAKPFKTTLQLTDKNFMGMAHQFSNEIFYDIKDPFNARLRGDYTVPYIGKTFATFNGYYSLTKGADSEGFSLSRPFYSSMALWAGGVSLGRSRSTLTYQEGLVTTPLETLRPDVWLGRGFPIKKGKTDLQRGTKLILFGRYYNTTYLKRPGSELDSAFSFPGSNTYLTSIGYSSQKFYKDRYIFRFGVAEDIPEGSVVAFTVGYQKIEQRKGLPYTGFKVGSGKHFPGLGYLSSTAETGFFINHGKAFNGTVQLKTFYFTERFLVGNWAFRQFVDYRITHGFMRDGLQLIDINGSNGLNGFNSGVLRGSNKMVFNTQCVMYTPYKLLGFQLACFLSTGFGIIGNSPQKMFKSHVYQSYGFGVLIRNEHLIFSTIQLSFGVYPNIPEKDKLYLKYNAVKIQDFRYSNFFYAPPSIITYQ